MKPTSDHSHLWNDLPKEERARLMPHQIEHQILIIWQCKKKAIEAHLSLMTSFDEQIKTLRAELKKK